MHYKRILNIVWIILWSCLITCSLNFPIGAQTKVDKKPELIDFGSSLKQKKENHKSEKKGQANKSANDEDVVKIDTNLVRTDVLVINDHGDSVSGLKKEDFIVSENDIPQQIAFFSLGDSVEVPRSIVLIIDYNGSQSPYIKNSIEAAKGLVDKLNPKDRMAIVTSDVKLLVNFTNDKFLLKNSLDILQKKAHTQKKFGLVYPNSALLATLNELFDEEDIRPMIILQDDFSSVAISPNDPQNDINSIDRFRPTIAFTLDDVLDRIEKSRVTIYSVIPGSSLLQLSPKERLKKTKQYLEEQVRSRKVSSEFLSLWSPAKTVEFIAEGMYDWQRGTTIIAQSSGGFASNLEKPEQADEVYSKILAGINLRYLIGYYPENFERDGKRRRIKIEVRGHPEYVVWGRKTYFAPETKK